MAQPGQKEDEQGRAFLPDLCTTRSVLTVVVVAELLAVVMVLAVAGHNGFSLQVLGLHSLFMQWVALTSAALLCGLRDHLNRLSLSWASTAVVALVVVDTFIFSLVADAVMGSVFALDITYRGLDFVQAVYHMLIAGIIAGVVMRYFYLQEQLRQKGEAELKARIQALQSRIRPHFLFNSMNIIASLIVVDPDAAEQAVEDLSKLFRASLKESGDQVSLKEELELCERYSRIEQLRLGDRLQINWDIRLDAQLYRLPLLALQPLLENAIYHGIQPLPEGGTVTIRATQKGNMLCVSVINPCSEQESSHKGNQMALNNIRQRLKALYGDVASLESELKDDQYEVLISVPVID